SLFETAISEAKYYVQDYESDIDLVGIDGTTYYFIMNNHPDKAGRTSFPSVDSNMWKLVRIAYGLVDYAKTEEFISFDEALILRIEQLKKDLVKKP
ncbi:MAG: hypothetical protein LIO93_09015, partial [Bacteroidales bacterium]|nr:hypothetical protein [Bacteroidales bacterium]